jgi:hypothetical protein
VHGADAHGHVLWFERYGDVDVPALSSMSDDTLALYRAQSMEALGAAKRAAAACAGRGQTALYCQHIYVLDLSGLTPAAVLSGPARRVLRAVTAVSSAHYGETLLRTYLVNAHPAARLAYAALRALLHPATAAKVRMCVDAAAFRAAAAEDGISADALPRVLGGGHDGVTIAQLIDARLEAHAAAAEARAAAAEEARAAAAAARAAEKARAAVPLAPLPAATPPRGATSREHAHAPLASLSATAAAAAAARQPPAGVRELTRVKSRSRRAAPAGGSEGAAMVRSSRACGLGGLGSSFVVAVSSVVLPLPPPPPHSPPRIR